MTLGVIILGGAIALFFIFPERVAMKVKEVISDNSSFFFFLSLPFIVL